MAAKNPVKKIDIYRVYIKKTRGEKYYLHSRFGKFVWDSMQKGSRVYGESEAKKIARREGGKIRRKDQSYGIYIEKK